MQHNIIKTENYLLVVDKESLTDMPKNINVYSVRYNKPIRFAETENSYMNECFEIKAHLPLNNSPILEGVDLLPPLEDEVEGLAEEWNDKGEFTSPYSFKAGYNKAKEKYKYTEKDVIKIVEKSRETGLTAEYLMLSLQQPKMPIAFECEKAKEKYKYTEEDILDAWELGASEGLPLTREKKNNLIKHLQQPKMPVGFLEKGSYNGTWVGEYIY
jgi:hypothetical protein